MNSSTYVSGSYSAEIYKNIGAGASAKYYFQNYDYEVGAYIGYKNQFGVSVGYSRYSGWNVGGSIYQAGASYNYGTKNWSYSYTLDVDALTDAYNEGVKSRQYNGYGPEGGENSPFYKNIDILGTITAGWEASDNHDDGYRRGLKKASVDFGILKDMVIGSISNVFQTNGFFRTAIGLTISPFYYTAVAAGGGPAYRAAQAP